MGCRRLAVTADRDDAREQQDGDDPKDGQVTKPSERDVQLHVLGLVDIGTLNDLAGIFPQQVFGGCL